MFSLISRVRRLLTVRRRRRGDEDDFHTLVRQARAAQEAEQEAERGAAQEAEQEAAREARSESVEVAPGSSTRSSSSDHVASLSGSGAGVVAGAGAEIVAVAGAEIVAGAGVGYDEERLIDLSRRYASSLFFKVPIWADRMPRKNYLAQCEHTLAQIDRSPKRNITQRCADTKPSGINGGWISRKTFKPHLELVRERRYNGQWLVKDFKIDLAGGVNYSKAFKEFVFANLLGLVHPDCAPKTRIARVDGLPYVASKFISGFKSLDQILSSDEREFYSDLEIAAVKILLQSILVGDRDIFVLGNFGFAKELNSMGRYAKVLKNIDYDRCGSFAFFARETGSTSHSFFTYIASLIGTKTELSVRERNIYLETMLCNDFCEQADQYFQINRKQILDVAQSSIKKFFSQFPSALNESVIDNIRKSLLYTDLTGEDQALALANNITNSIAHQIIYIKIWTVFIDFEQNHSHYTNLEDYAISQVEHIKLINVLSKVEGADHLIIEGITSLAPIFCKMCKWREKMQAAVDAEQRPLERSPAEPVVGFVSRERLRVIPPGTEVPCAAAMGK